MVAAWLLFPLVLLLVCLGCGLTIERLAGWDVPGSLLPSLGLALVIVAASLTTQLPSTAPLTTPLVLVLTVAGYASSTRRLRALRPEPWCATIGLAVFAVCAAPVVLSGNATFLGYYVLNDSAFHFALIDQLLAHGRDLSGVPPSAYRAVLSDYISTSYPTGADVALGAVRPLVGQDIAWIFQPYLAVILALGGAALYELLRAVVRARPLRWVCAFIASQSGLVYAYYLEASIKEVATTLIITLTVVLVFATLSHDVRLRRVLPLVVAVAAGLYVLDLAIVPWLGLPVATFVLVAGWRGRRVMRSMGRRRLAAVTAGTAAALAIAIAPLLARASTFLTVATGVLTTGGDLGNLLAPLQNWQLLGIWPSGDFRVPVETHYRITYALLGLVLASAILGGLWTLRRRASAPALLLIGDGIAAAYLLSRGSPYADAKVLMVLSVAVMLAAMLGGAALYDAGRRIEGWALAAVIAAGVLWTNALAYHDAAVAPRARLTELAAIGRRFSGRGPAFFNQSEEFAIHFLRNLAPADPADGPLEPRAGLPVSALPAGRLPWDPDDLAPAYLQSFRLLVLGRSPRISRPPADYRLAYQGEYYDVWQRTSSPQVLEHVSLGTGLYPFAVPSCRLVKATASRAASEHARLAYVTGTPAPALVPTQATRPPNWGLVDGDPFELIPRQQAGSLTGLVRVAHAGRYEVWLEGSLSQRFVVWVGRQLVGTVAYQLGPPGQFIHVGEVTLAEGSQPVLIVRPPSNLSPGDDPIGQLLGPLMLVRDTAPPAVTVVDPGQARDLCGRYLDWIEIVR